MSDLPLDHVHRPALPWREDEHLTECGLQADSYPTITRDELVARWKTMGQQRCYVLTCVTCLQTCQRWPTWDENPVGAIGRAVGGFGHKKDERLRRELIALAHLASKYRDEFDGMVDGLSEVGQLTEARTARRRRNGPR